MSIGICLYPSPAGIITTVAGNGSPGYSGDGGLATSAQLVYPWGLAADTGGNIYVVDNGGNAIREVQPVALLPFLSIAKSHSDSFNRGQTGAIYSVVVSNSSAAGPSLGVVTVAETVPSGLALVSMAGAGWSCAANACTRSDVLNPGASGAPQTAPQTLNFAPGSHNIAVQTTQAARQRRPPGRRHRLRGMRPPSPRVRQEGQGVRQRDARILFRRPGPFNARLLSGDGGVWERPSGFAEGQAGIDPPPGTPFIRTRPGHEAHPFPTLTPDGSESSVEGRGSQRRSALPPPVT